MSDPLSKPEQLALVRELKASTAFNTILLPHFKAQQETHNRAVKDRNKKGKKRAEHIEAAHAFDELVTFLDTLEASLESTIAQTKKK